MTRLLPGHSSFASYRDLFFHPTSSTKQFRISTKLLRDENEPEENIFSGAEVTNVPTARKPFCRHVDFVNR